MTAFRSTCNFIARSISAKFRFLATDFILSATGEDVKGHINLMLTHPLAVKTISAKLRGTYIVAFELRTEGLY